jgi:hypothetical protein
MQFNLVPHPSTEPDPPFKVWVNVDHAGSLGAVATTNLWFGIGAPAARFVIPQVEGAGRADELWRTTCIEAFLKPVSSPAYREWNFAPSGQWAAYDFTGYRENMSEAEVAAEPYVRMEDNLTWWAVGATITMPADIRWELGLSAVLEEQSGAKTYWALAHRSEKPDFHAPGCFAARLA